MTCHQRTEHSFSDGQVFILHETQYGAEKAEKHYINIKMRRKKSTQHNK